MRILIVDDYPPFASSLRLLLKPEHACEVAPGGREALALLERDSAFDVVLCDLLMPDVSGMQLYDALEKARPALASRMLFMTGGAYPAEAQDFLERTQAPVLTKPFSPEALAQAVARVAGGRP